MLKVGKDFVFDKKKGKGRGFLYDDVQYDSDQWADAKKYLPADFDLLYLKIENHPRIIPGWSIGKKWDGLDMQEKYIVTHWKFQIGYEHL
jgi:hypothetical protein